MRAFAAMLAMLLWLPAAAAAEHGAPPPEPGEVEYYAADNGQAVGPLSLAQMEERIRKGQTMPDDLVWKTGQEDWASAQTLTELQQAFAGARPPGPQDAGLSKLMVGTWETIWQEEGWVMQLRVAYSADGSFSGALIGNPPEGHTTQMPLNGTWSARPLKGSSFTLAITHADGRTMSLRLRVLDDHTLENVGDGETMRKVAM